MMGRNRFRTRFARAAALAPALALAGCGRGTPAEPPPSPRAVQVSTVFLGPSTAPVSVTGTLATREESRLGFKVGGVIRSIEVREGDAIEAGQMLARLDATEVRADVTQAREAYAKARRDAERGRELFTRDVIAREQRDDLMTAEAVARAQLQAAEFNAGRAVIRAPRAGRVLRRLAQPSEQVAPGQPVLVVSDDRSGEVLQVQLADRDYVNVRLGDPASVIFDALPGKRYIGHVSLRAEAADARSGAFPVEVTLDRDAAAGKPPLATGLIGRALIQTRGEGRLAYVPLSALVEGNQQRVTLFTVRGEPAKVQLRSVSVAFIAGDRAALTDALPEGIVVISSGAPYLHDGEIVRIVR